MRDQLLAPLEGVARVVPRAIEELAEVHVEVAQEGVRAVGVGDRDAEIASVLLGPDVEGEGLRIAQPRPERLTGLHVLVRHRAQRRQVVAHGEPDIRGAREVLGPILLPGLRQVTPIPDPDTGLAECNWTASYVLAVPSSWVSGVYLAKLTGQITGKQSYIIFTVRDDARASAILFQNSVTTYHAYNN